jgi:IclR family KDG regulon transcriptional repressor
MDKTLVKGLAVLEALAKSERPRGITEVSQELSMTKSNVHRFVQTLAECGYIKQDSETGRYLPTLKAWEIGYEVLSRSTLKRAFSPYAEDLARRTGQLVHVTVVSGEELLFMEQIGAPNPHPLRRWPIGGKMKFWEFLPGGHDLVAIQLAYMATLVSAKQEWLLKKVDDESHHMVTSEDLLKRIDETKQRGYAINQGEWHEAIRGSAATFFYKDGESAGVLGLMAQSEGATLADLERWGKTNKECADAISYTLGYRSTSKLRK